MKALLITVYGDITEVGYEVVETDGSLDSIYGLLGVNNIDIAERCVGEDVYSIVVDDEGLLVDDVRLSARHVRNPNYCLAGNLLVFGCDGSPELIGLTDEDVSNLTSHIRVGVGCSGCSEDDGLFGLSVWPVLELD